MPDQIRVQKPPPNEGEAPDADAQSLPSNLPVMPLRDTVLFPGIIQPLTVGRPRSLALVQEAAMGDRLFAAMLQQDAAEEEPGFDRIADVGCAVRILKLVRMPDETQSVIIQAVGRIRAEGLTQSDPFYRADIEAVPDVVREGDELDALTRTARDLMMRVIELSPRIPQEGAAVLASIESPGHLADFIGANLNLATAQKQELLEEPRVDRRLRRVTQLMQREIQVLELASKIQSQTRGRIEESQREHFLREQLKSIQEELGEKDEKTALVEQLRADLDEADPPDAVRTEADRELRRLQAMPSYAPDFNVLRTYLEYLAELPWHRRSDDRIDLKAAEHILNEDHYGLEEPKKRILEYLAVQKLRATVRGPILCFVGRQASARRASARASPGP